MKNRRSFLKTAGAGTAGILMLGAGACQTSSQKTASLQSGIGLQLYSIRDAMQADVAGTLKKVADMGYQYLELAGYSNGKFYGMTPRDFKKLVSDLGMEIISSHTMVEAKGITMENAKKMADDHAQLGVKYCIQPWINEEDRYIDQYKKMIADWNKVGEIMQHSGIQFGYHNHNFEFEPTNGLVPYFDIFMKEMDPDLITMELDVYWATKAGQDPVQLFERFPGRFQLLHFKDATREEAPYFEVKKDDIAPVGQGHIDFQRIYNAHDIAGTQYFFVEDDNQGNGKPFEGIKASITYLQQLK